MPWSEPLPLKVLRNADFQVVTLERNGHAVLRFALAYGFRNIQTIVSRAPLEVPIHYPASLASSYCLWKASILYEGTEAYRYCCLSPCPALPLLPMRESWRTPCFYILGQSHVWYEFAGTEDETEKL